MVDSNKIKWKNIYYMLTYAVDEIPHMKIGDVDMEKCKSLDDLFAALLCKALDFLKSNKYISSYNKVRKSTDKPHGNILIQQSYNSGDIAYGKLCCEYFELNINSRYNIILKSTIECLIEYGKGISNKHLISLNQTLEELNTVKSVELMDIDFDSIDYKDITEWYKPAILVSKLIAKELLSKDKEGKSKLFRLDENDRLRYIFEKFVRNFYNIEYKNGITSHPVYEVADSRKNNLDMLVECDSSAIIIDTKWYESKNYKNNRVNNIREVLDYAISYKEHETELGCTNRRLVYCILLYAKTGENSNILTRREVRSFGNDYGECEISEKTIDLNQEFTQIKTDLIRLIDNTISL